MTKMRLPDAMRDDSKETSDWGIITFIRLGAFATVLYLVYSLI